MADHQDFVRGNYWTLFFDDFPLAQILSPLLGWEIRGVVRWRQGCPDACWRMVMKRTAVRPTPKKAPTQ